MSLDSQSYEMFPTNTLLSAGSGFLAFVANLDPVMSVTLTVGLFLVGKGIDVALRFYFEKRPPRRK